MHCRPLLCAPAEGARVERALFQKARLHRDVLPVHDVLRDSAAEGRDICVGHNAQSAPLGELMCMAMAGSIEWQPNVGPAGLCIVVHQSISTCCAARLSTALTLKPAQAYRQYPAAKVWHASLLALTSALRCRLRKQAQPWQCATHRPGRRGARHGRCRARGMRCRRLLLAAAEKVRPACCRASGSAKPANNTWCMGN